MHVVIIHIGKMISHNSETRFVLLLPGAPNKPPEGAGAPKGAAKDIMKDRKRTNSIREDNG